jgi:hypothetical protein
VTQVEHLREQSRRAQRLARDVLDALTIQRLTEASEHYRHEADQLESRLAHRDGQT